MFAHAAKQFANLGNLAEENALKLQSYETDFATVQVHRLILLLEYSHLDASSQVPSRHLNIIVLGESATGKTHAMRIVENMGYKFTSQSISFSTNKSIFTPGNSSYMWNTSDEAQADLLRGGASSGGGSGPGGKGPSTQSLQVNVIKTVIDSGYILFEVFMYDPITKERDCVVMMRLFNTSHAWLSNADRRFIDQHVADRFFIFHVWNLSHLGQSESRDMLQTICDGEIEQMLTPQQSVIDRFRQLQMCTFLRNVMIETGKIRFPTSLEYTFTMYPLIMREARRFGIANTAHVRLMFKVAALVNGLVVEHAFLDTFRNGLSPFRGRELPSGRYEGKPFSLEQIVHHNMHVMTGIHNFSLWPWGCSKTSFSILGDTMC